MNTQKAMLSIGIFLLRLALIILIAVGIYRIGGYAYVYGYSIVSDAAVDESPGRDVSVTITSKMTVQDIAYLLEKKGLVEDATIFRLQLKFMQYDDKLEPGSYLLNTSMAPSEMMAVLAGESEDEDS